MEDDFARLRSDVREFVRARGWERFHAPKNLAMALAVEAAELLEQFQWLTTEESDELDEATKGAVADELADVQIYLIQLSERLGIDLLRSVREKMAKNARKYPAPGPQ